MHPRPVRFWLVCVSSFESRGVILVAPVVFVPSFAVHTLCHLGVDVTCLWFCLGCDGWCSMLSILCRCAGFWLVAMLDFDVSCLHTGGGNSSYMQRLVKGDFRRVFHAAVGKRLVFFHVKVGTDILFF